MWATTFWGTAIDYGNVNSSFSIYDINDIPSGREAVKIQVDETYKLIESVFDFLLVVDTNEKIIYASRALLNECNTDWVSFTGKALKEALSSESYSQVKEVMKSVRKGQRQSVVFTSAGDLSCSIALKARFSDDSNKHFIFYGSLVDKLDKFEEWEKQERIKELSCLYNVAEWIEVSSSIKDFFTELPDYLARGMQYPQQTIVCSIYQGVEYGQRIETDKYIKVDLVVANQARGEIQVGYFDSKLEFLPEEQKMLNEIARMLNLALERKEFKDTLALKQAEESEFADKITKLKQEIEARTRELEAQSGKLSTVNAYLDRINRDWEESKVRLETTFAAIPDQVAIIDLKRNVIMTNRTNVPAGNKCHKTFFDSDTPCQDCRLLRVIREKTPIALEIKRDDDYFEVHALPIFNPNHEVEGIIEFYRDITKEKIYEQQLQQADKLASLGQLVSGIGHEINNPNQFIRGNVKIIEQSLADMLPILDEYYKTHPDLRIARLKYDFFREHIMMLVKDMEHGSERIKGIVEGLKRFARRDEGLLIDTVDVNTIIDESTRLVHNQIHKYADIKTDLARDIPTFNGNSQKIEQVIINLLINAGQAMPEGKKGLVEVVTRREGNDIIIDVKDNGKGMSEQTIKHIFEPFFTTRRATGGTGLGLSIAYRIIEEHGGHISVSSKMGIGTTFTIRIPVGNREAKKN